MPQTALPPGFCFGIEKWELPPLILDPFSDQQGPAKLVESSRASLMLYGLLPNEDFTEDELTRKLLEGRLCEIRMLFFVGKDLLRWVGQCMECVGRIESLGQSGIREQSFASLLIDSTPPPVQTKLKKWGVNDYKAIFSRGIGLNSVFRQVPNREHLTDDFIKTYYRFADHLYACRQQLAPYTEISPKNFRFELFASGEYSRMLERQWEQE